MTALLLTTGLVTLAAFTLLWMLSLRMKDASIVDLYWGPGFVVVAWIAWLLGPSANWGQLVLLVCVTLWGVRLGLYIAGRRYGEEDPRYREMRERHGAAFANRSLWMVFWLQAAILWVASSPALTAMTIDRPPVVPLVVVGVVLFGGGLAIEVAADQAVAQFKANPANAGRLLTDGLHSIVRHPNYLGEIILQWGLGFIGLGVSMNPLALVGPALMTLLIVKLSGVPMMEAQLSGRPGFAEWRSRTGALLPRMRKGRAETRPSK